MEKKYRIDFTDAYGNKKTVEENVTLVVAFEYVRKNYPNAYGSVLGYKAKNSKEFHGNPSWETSISIVPN